MHVLLFNYYVFNYVTKLYYMYIMYRDIVPLISSTGAIGIYSTYFASVNREASIVYLDATFVDMMWYKAFSVWTMLQLGYDILFQDVDLVWFREPYQYFKDASAEYLHKTGETLTGFFSDDGQRGTIRYAPFFFNSGFYYIKPNNVSINIAWNIMLSFDVMQSGGSHQNVFTQRLMEALDFGHVKPKALHEHDFATGASYHHDKSLMHKIATHKYLPYNFHMCWTADKKQKLEFFRKVNMWYINPKLDIKDFVNDGKFAKPKKNKKGSYVLWKDSPPTFCKNSPKSP
jgi:hypothetical protein